MKMGAVELVKDRQLRHIPIGEVDDQLKLEKGTVKDTYKGMSLWNWMILLTEAGKLGIQNNS